MWTSGYIGCKAGEVIRVRCPDGTFESGGSIWPIAVQYNAMKESTGAVTYKATSGTSYDAVFDSDGKGFSITIQHHLRIFLGIYQNSLAVLEIDNVEELVCHDEAVAGAEAVRHIAGEVQPLLNEHLGVRAVLPGFLDGFQNEFQVAVRVHLHFVGVVLADRAGGAHLQCLAELVFRQRMSGSPFCGSFRFSVLKLQFQPCGWIAVKPAVGGRCREDCVMIRGHLSAPPHL